VAHLELALLTDDPSMSRRWPRLRREPHRVNADRRPRKGPTGSAAAEGRDSSPAG
jgi:hypothetical protein